VVVSSSSSDDVRVSTQQQTCSQPVQQPKSQPDVTGISTTQPLSLNEYNVGPVLEKLLAMMQSMSMLLSALKNDLRHSNMPEVVAKKRNVATTQLWRAFIAYQKSFSEIEQFARETQRAMRAHDERPRLRVSQAAGQAARRPECSSHPSESEVIELSESDSDDDVECKGPRCDSAETVKPSAETPPPPSPASVEPAHNTSVSGVSADLASEPTLVISSCDSPSAPSASASNVSIDVSSDTSASCIRVD